MATWHAYARLPRPTAQPPTVTRRIFTPTNAQGLAPKEAKNSPIQTAFNADTLLEIPFRFWTSIDPMADARACNRQGAAPQTFYSRKSADVKHRTYLVQQRGFPFCIYNVENSRPVNEKDLEAWCTGGRTVLHLNYNKILAGLEEK
jgi:hypothetical protein